MSLLSDLQQADIQWAQRLNQLETGEVKQVILQKRVPGTNGLADGLIVDEVEFSKKGINGRFLPPEIEFELRISEAFMTEADAKTAVAIKHGTRLYQVLPPSPFHPVADFRFWRFWVRRAEELLA